jgi:hypothetical protein
MKLQLEADPAPSPQSEPVNRTPLILEAIVRERCVSLTYNRTRMIVAPHILYTRAGALYTDAAIVSREGMLPREDKIGTFKLDGMKDLILLERPFTISPLFDAELDKYRNETLMMVEPQPPA